MTTRVVFETATMTRVELQNYRRSLSVEGKSVCGKCREVKPKKDFNSDIRTPNGLSNRCRSCHSVTTRISSRLVGTGWTEAEYRKAFAEQEGKCAICKQPEPREGRELCADHCHATQAKRGLLCSNCNLLLGHARDNLETLRAAIRYLGGQ